MGVRKLGPPGREVPAHRFITPRAYVISSCISAASASAIALTPFLALRHPPLLVMGGLTLMGFFVALHFAASVSGSESWQAFAFGCRRALELFIVQDRGLDHRYLALKLLALLWFLARTASISRKRPSSGISWMYGLL